MASDNPVENDKKTSDPSPAEVLDLEAAAFDEALEGLTQLPPEFEKTPRIKDLLQSSDAPSRYMTILAILFSLLAVATFGLLISLYLKHRAAHRVAPQAHEQVVVAAVINESLGEFKMFLNPDQGEQSELRVDIVAECSTPEACNYLKEHLPQARDVVIPVLSVATKAELLSIDSKNLIRRRIVERLNSIPMEGKVLQVHFTDLTIE